MSEPWRLGFVALSTAVIAAISVAAGDVAFATDPAESVAELEVVDRAESTIASAIAERRRLLRVRLVALRAEVRRSTTRSVFGRRGEQAIGRARADLIRIVGRDVRELRELSAELDWVRDAERGLRARDNARLGAVELTAPVVGARPTTPARDRRRGGVAAVERGFNFEVASGAEVRAPIAGTVVYRGPLGSLGDSVVVAGDGTWIVLGPIEADAALDSRVGRGARLGIASGDRLYLESRAIDGFGGRPIRDVSFSD